jgi:hypothetical protein
MPADLKRYLHRAVLILEGNMKVKSILALGLAAALVATMAGASDAEAKKKRASCALVTGEGTGITEALARNSAATSLSDIAAKTGGKRTGAVKTTCTKSMGGIVNTCRSQQRLCK